MVLVSHTSTPVATPVPLSYSPTPLPPTPIVTPSPSAPSLPSAFSRFLPNVSYWVDGDSMVVWTSTVPDHPSPYFPWTDNRYQPYNGANPYYIRNPNWIVPHSLYFRIPLSPRQAARHSTTPLGPIGVALNGVPFFNQYAGPNRPLTLEINSFDQFNGHPQATGMYHYHVEPLSLTSQYGRDALVGFLLDGFPVYGPVEGGREVTNSDLDQFHGHVHATPEYPQGTYHYHIAAEAPYINGAGFYGVPGTVAAR
ncbi:MAG: YHYH protein [Chloroflexi bacterium]|nr:YHYH protein [Chloroflexota bacterium]